MPRPGPPPPELTDEQKHTMGLVRKEIWTKGWKGMVTGSLSGLVLHSMASVANNRGYLQTKTKLNASTALVATLLGGAVGSYTMSVTAGKNQVHQLHPIFETNKKKSIEEQQDEAMEELQRNRLLRRASLKESMEHGHGLGDAHGGQWRNVSTEERERHRVARRTTVQDSLSHGHGLSDSHGGKWIK